MDPAVEEVPVRLILLSEETLDSYLWEVFLLGLLHGHREAGFENAVLVSYTAFDAHFTYFQFCRFGGLRVI